MEKFIESILNNLKHDKVFTIIMLILIFGSIAAYYFVSHNESFYKQTIAKVVSVNNTKNYVSMDSMGNQEKVYDQTMTGLIMNGKYKNKLITLNNTYSYSQAYDDHYEVGDELFISIPSDYNGNSKIVADVNGVKRDSYIVGVILLFSLVLILCGRSKGLKSLVSLLVNIILFVIAINLYLSGGNLYLLMGIASILFIVMSIAISVGIRNKKAISAILSTVVGVGVSFAIALIVITLTNSRGIRYEEMEFITKPEDQIFMMEILMGTIGAIMDIGISISASIQELYEVNPKITHKELVASSKEIGNDIMSTMTNTLLFAYISGSIPFILLWLKNGLSISYVVGVDLSLEMIRALTGSIGIVISIPISTYIATYMLKKRGEIK